MQDQEPSTLDQENQPEQLQNSENTNSATPEPQLTQPSAEQVAPLPKKSFFKKKQFIFGLLAGVIVIAVAGYFVIFSGGKDNTQANNENSEVTSSKLGIAPSVVDGTVTYKTSSSDWQPLTTETKLSEGDIVSTEAGGRVVLTLDDGSAIRLDESTTVNIVSLDPKSVEFDQTAGFAYSRVVASDRKYTVKADGVGYTAQGTAFTTTNNETEKGCQVIQSSVKVDGVSSAVAEGKQYFKKSSDANLQDKTTDINLDNLKSDDFMLWNMEQDEKDTKFKDRLGVWQKVKEQTNATPAAATPAANTSSNGLKLSAKNNEKGTVLSWTVTGVDGSKGFKVVRSSKSNTPTFGKDEAVYVSDSKSRSYTWKSDKEGTFWYRVCTYRPDQGTCDNYSNAVQMAAVYSAPEKVTRGTMTAVLAGDGRTVGWTYTGNAKYGYKVVVSKDANPTYPEDGYVYYGDGSTFELEEDDLEPGNNYVRVCAYTSGTESEKCVDYSNQLTVTKP